MPGTYRKLAEYYDQLFPFAHSWGEQARETLLGELLERIGSVCDLGCGTGTTVLELARRGLEVYGVDLSPAMCAVARQKARRARLPVRIIRADMRSFRLPAAVDLITCEFDALNHVPEKPDLFAVTRSVARALHPGGHFYFDVNNRASFEKMWPLTWWAETRGVAIAMHGGHDRASGKAFSTVELFVRKGRCWQRSRARVEEVCWTYTEIRNALLEAGFDRIRHWDATRVFTRDPLLRPGYRTFYLARKRAAARQ